MVIFKNFLSFGLTFGAYDWIVDGGARPTMLAIASVQVVICATSIPMCSSSFHPLFIPDPRLTGSIRRLRQTHTGFLSPPRRSQVHKDAWQNDAAARETTKLDMDLAGMPQVMDVVLARGMYVEAFDGRCRLKCRSCTPSKVCWSSREGRIPTTNPLILLALYVFEGYHVTFLRPVPSGLKRACL